MNVSGAEVFQSCYVLVPAVVFFLASALVSWYFVVKMPSAARFIKGSFRSRAVRSHVA